MEKNIIESKFTFSALRKGLLYLLLLTLAVFLKVSVNGALLAKVIFLAFSAFSLYKVVRKPVLLHKDSIIAAAVALLLFAAALHEHAKGQLSLFFSLAKKGLAPLDFFILAVCLFAVMRYVCYAVKEEAFWREKNPVAQKKIVALLKYALPVLLLLFLRWQVFFPSGVSPDTYSQWQQIHGQIPFSNVHSVGHTLFLRTLLSFHDSYSIVILAHMLLFSSIVAVMLTYFQEKGINRRLLLGVPFLLTASGMIDVMMYPWKDTPYTLCVMLFSFVLMRVLLDKGQLPLFWQIVGGLALAGTWLNRHNGVFIFVFGIAAFVYFCFKFSYKKFLPVIGVALATLLTVNFFAFNVFGALQRTDGTPYAVFGNAIVSVVANDGNITEEQMERLRDIMPIDDIARHYQWSYGSELVWLDVSIGPEGYEIGPYRSALRERPKEIVSLYFELLPKNIPLMAAEIMGGTRNIWQLTNNLVFDNSFQLALVLVAALCFARKKKLAYLLPFLPVVLNVLSIAVSATTNEPRYLLPTNLFYVFLLLYAPLACRQQKEEEENTTGQALGQSAEGEN